VRAPPELAEAPAGLLVAVILVWHRLQYASAATPPAVRGPARNRSRFAGRFGDVLIGAVAVVYFAPPMPAWYNAVSFAAWFRRRHWVGVGRRECGRGA